MQPLAEVTLTRPWHWGIAVLGDPLAEVPTEFDDGRTVALSRDVVALRVRHAQDIEAVKFSRRLGLGYGNCPRAVIGTGGSDGTAHPV